MVARRSALLLVAALLAMLLPASAASASWATKVIVSLKVPAFHGKLKSDKSACKTGRTVKLLRKRPGPDKVLGTDRSNAKAKWSIPIGLKPGSYYAKAPAAGRCRAGKSKVLTI